MELYTDTYYIQRIQAGDVACFACLLDKYSRPINSLILKVIRSQEEETTLENVSEEEITNLFGQTESTEQVQRLEVALEQLLPDERALILLFYWKEKTIEELVSITGLTASNIKVKLHRIRKKLFVLLNGMDHE